MRHYIFPIFELNFCCIMEKMSKKNLNHPKHTNDLKFYSDTPPHKCKSVW